MTMGSSLRQVFIKPQHDFFMHLYGNIVVCGEPTRLFTDGACGSVPKKSTRTEIPFIFGLPKSSRSEALEGQPYFVRALYTKKSSKVVWYTTFAFCGGSGINHQTVFSRDRVLSVLGHSRYACSETFLGHLWERWCDTMTLKRSVHWYLPSGRQNITSSKCGVAPKTLLERDSTSLLTIMKGSSIVLERSSREL